MGGNSTSHGAVLSDKKTQQSGAFDLQSWQGLTALLKTGKEALHDPVEYAAFRNLVLQYAQHGGDIELKQKILDAVKNFKETPVQDTPSEVTTAQNTTEISEKKTEPNVAHTDTPKNASAPVSVSTRRLLPRFEENIKKENLKSTTFVPKENSSSIQDTPLTPQSVEELTTPQPALRVEPEIVVPVPTPVPPAPRMPEPTQPEATPITYTIDNHKSRITEIKKSVHSLFGNPAALMNLHNGVGQIYMKALLLAMKATDPGSDENADLRMSELEVAYKALVSEGEMTQTQERAPVEIVKEEIPVPEALPKVEEPAIEVTPVPEVAELTEIEPESIPVEAPVSVIHEEKEEPKPEIKHSAQHTLDQLSSRAVEERKLSAVPEKIFTEQKEVRSVPLQSDTPEIEPLKVQQDLPKTYVPRVSVVDRSRTTEMETKQSELVSEEISAALKKLLHDWSIFEGSGLFGIGPGGIDHPLYQKLAPLSMGEVIAGRWEKSDPKITKTIKEYVDAWRHEQGIAYTINETFEHYLRRVIQRILKRQSA
ncbi:MAG: hypothetical protein WAW13_01315 [Minisyncoccia bacterium]